MRGLSRHVLAPAPLLGFVFPRGGSCTPEACVWGYGFEACDRRNPRPRTYSASQRQTGAESLTGAGDTGLTCKLSCDWERLSHARAPLLSPVLHQSGRHVLRRSGPLAVARGLSGGTCLPASVSRLQLPPFGLTVTPLSSEPSWRICTWRTRGSGRRCRGKPAPWVRPLVGQEGPRLGGVGWGQAVLWPCERQPCVGAGGEERRPRVRAWGAASTAHAAAFPGLGTPSGGGSFSLCPQRGLASPSGLLHRPLL